MLKKDIDARKGARARGGECNWTDLLPMQCVTCHTWVKDRDASYVHTMESPVGSEWNLGMGAVRSADAWGLKGILTNIKGLFVFLLRSLLFFHALQLIG